MSRLDRLTLGVTGLLVAIAVAGASASAQTAAPRAPVPAVSLEGTTWKLTHLGTQVVKASASTRSPRLFFHEGERRVSGSGGCNRLSGQYKLGGDRLTFTPLATTRMVCPDAIDLESRFLAALEKVATYRIVGQQLELYDAKGTLLARFTS